MLREDQEVARAIGVMVARWPWVRRVRRVRVAVPKGHRQLAVGAGDACLSRPLTVVSRAWRVLPSSSGFWEYRGVPRGRVVLVVRFLGGRRERPLRVEVHRVHHLRVAQGLGASLLHGHWGVDRAGALSWGQAHRGWVLAQGGYSCRDHQLPGLVWVASQSLRRQGRRRGLGEASMGGHRGLAWVLGVYPHRGMEHHRRTRGQHMLHHR